ncbi:hypothetical protein GOARA_005_00080 [Gordonia araii NBRC 100433]|uniref:Uncharacterized protein n=1 Tax=Gordonia araii NBRC 100433 TaxID=1073574 RepID=G7GX88_9ACTN|nr:hypothetical protein GOARA_005_00080 [Gordonia araii NBRC 100433]
MAVAAGAWLTVIATGEAQAAPGTLCQAANGHNQQKVRGESGCGARAGKGSTARAEDTSGEGTAVAVANSGGRSDARNLERKSTAMAGAQRGGKAHSYTTGPGAFSVAQADRNGTSVAIGGWGGSAISTPRGTACAGGFAFAWESNSGRVCLRSGSVGYSN